MHRYAGTRLLLALALLFVSSAAPRTAGAQSGTPAHVPGEVIIKFRSNATEQEKDQVRSALGGSHLRAFGRIRAELRRLGTLSVEEAVAQYRAHPKVEYIEPNYIVSVVETPNDPRFSELYGLQNTGQTGGTPGADIRATNAWDVFKGSSQTLIGVIDTGVDYTHPDLAANAWTNPGEIPGNGVDDDSNGYVDDIHGWDFVNNDNDPMDDHGHGSHVSGTIGAVGNNGIGVVGVCWNVRIMGLKFLSASGSGSTANAVLAVEYATRMGVRLTSNSWGGGGFSQALYDAIRDAGTAGILFVAAAGNNGANTDTSPHYPSSYDLPNIVAVAATDHNDRLASFSNFGATTVDLAAPGVNILSTFPGNNYGSISGTSMATPHVSGALGLVFGRFPGIGHLDAKSLILNFADPLPNLAGVVATGGRLNAFMPIADPDSIPPAAIAGVTTTDAGSNWLVAGWTATGDDGTTGTASRYVVKYSTSPIDAGNFDAANSAPDPPDPGAPGSSESLRIAGLDFNTTYFVAVKALDEFGNASPISNVATGTTLGIPDIAAAPLSLSQTLLSGASSVQSLTLSNVGEGTLDFQIPTPQLITSPPVQAAYVALGKDEPDPRPGILGSGGPDGFGYRWADSDDPAGPAFNWVDISGTGTLVISSGDDVNQGPFPIGFTFPFYGVDYTEFRVCSNGWLSFNSTSTAYANQPLPNSGAPTAMIAPFWDDLTAVTSGDVYYRNDGSRLIVQWNAIPHYGSGGPYTFQAILGSDGSIVFQYLSMGSPTNSATVGIQNAARTDGLQVAYNAAWVHDNLAVRIAAVPQWVTVTPTEGTIHAPNSLGLDVSLDATGLLGGVYEGIVRILSNDPDESPFEVPVQLTVIGAPDVNVAPSSLAFGQVFVGATPVQTLTVQNPGTDVLHVSAVSVDNGAYTLSHTAFDVPPRGSVDVAVTFSPLAAMGYPATITVLSDDPDEPSLLVPVSGEGVPPPAFSVNPTALTSNLYTGTTESQALTLQNSGGADLEWSLTTEFVVGSQSYTLAAPPVPAGPDEDGGVPAAEFQSSPVQAELADLTGVDILWDRSNGQSTTSSWTTIVADLTARGATLTQSTAALTPALLAGYDVLWLVDPSSTATWDPAELAAVVDWVGAGGGLLLEGDNTATVPWYNQLLAALNAGIQYSLTDNATGTSPNIHPHPTTAGVTGIYLTAATASIGSISAPAGPLVDDINGLPNTAWSQVGPGRIVAAADELFQNSRMGTASNRLFGNQVMDWLSSPAFLLVSPSAGTVAPGGTQVVNASFDANGLFGGLYQANIRIQTNDPLAPQVTVPAALTVTGAPDLVLEPTAIDFGTVYVGYPALREFQVRNAGTDVLNITNVVSDDPAFSVFLGGNPFPIAVAPLATTVLQVRYAPAGVGPATGVLSIQSNDPDAPSVPLAVSGSGLLPPVASVAPTSLHADLLSGHTETQQFVLSNTGASDLTWSTQIQFHASATQRFTLTAPEAPPGPDEDGGTIGPDFRTTPIQADLADLTGIDILWDRSNGQVTTSSWSTIVADLTARGATLTQSTEPLTPALLASHDVLWLVDPSSTATWDPAELDAVVGWVRAGGGLLLEGDNTASVPWYNQLLTALEAGIEFSTTDNATGVSGNVHPHATTEGVTGVYLTAATASIGAIASPAGPLVDDINGRPNTAYSIVGAGRIIAAADEIFQNGHLGSGDNQRFGNQVMDWLASPVFLALDPASGVLAPGGTATVNVTFDAGGLLGGDYGSDLRVLSNDPANGALTVVATMHVTGVPRIALTPSTVDFGTTFLGYPETLTLTVKNDGTDVLSVSSITPGLGDYTVDASTFDVPPFQSRDVMVTFSPQAVGPRNSSLAIASNDPASPHQVALAGAGLLAPVASVSPASVHADLLTGETATVPLTLSNSGGSELVWSSRVKAALPTQAFTLTAPEAVPGTDADGGAAAAVIRTTPIQATLADLTNVRVLYDRSNGQVATTSWTTIIADLTSRGATVTVSTDPITPALLSGYDVVWLTDPGSTASWDPAELAALTAWVNGGGGLLLEGDNASSVEMYNELLAALNAGIVFSDVDGATGTSPNIHPHVTTQGVAGIYITAAVASIGSVSGPAGRLVDDIDGLINTAHSQAGAGRIVAAADELFQNSRMGTADNQLFGNQVFDWLATPSYLSLAPASGIVPAGGTAPVDVTFDATGMFGGDYAATIELLSNDPANPRLHVAATLHVTPVPRIGFSAPSLAFGDAYVGYPESMTLTVTNVGTDLLTVSSIAPGLPDYSVDAASFDLDPFESRDLLVTFGPQAAGDRSSTLSFASNDPDSPHGLPVSGNGVLPPVIAASPDTIEAAALPGMVKTRTLTVCNTGASDLVWSARIQSAVATQEFTLTAPDASSGEADGGTVGPDFRTASIRAALADLTGVRVLYDRSNGQVATTSWTTIIADLTSRGATVTVSSDPITPALLADHNVFWSTDPGSTALWDATELAALTAWVNGGGGLLLEGDNVSSVEMFNQLLAALGAGIVFSEADNATGTSPNIHPHVTTQGVTGIYITAAVASIGSVAAPAGRLVDDVNGVPNAAYSEVGSGRIVAAADELFQNGRMGMASNQLFGNQVFDWLATPAFLSLSPESGVIPAGECTVLTVTLDATELDAGDHAAAITLLSNDPATPALTTPVLFHVGSIAAADTDLDPDVVNLLGSGAWVTAFVELPAGYAPEDIVLETVRCNGVAASRQASTIGDFNANGIPDRQFKFPLADVLETLVEGDSSMVTLLGEIEDTIYFTGVEYVRVMNPRLLRPNGGEVFTADALVEVLWRNPVGLESAPASLWYSSDAGETWTLVADAVTGQSHIWRVPLQPTTAGFLRVCIHQSAQRVLGFDTSEQAFTISDAVAGTDRELPTEYGLRFAAANPVVQGLPAVELSLPAAGPVSVDVYDLRGALVRELVAAPAMEPGRHRIEWDRADRGGGAVSAGVYFIRARAGGRTFLTRFAILP